MGDALEFGDKTADRLETLYATEDVKRRRRLALAALDARPGEEILDLGCGPGFYVGDLADAVGPAGRVTGVDPSESMLDKARARNAGRDNVELVVGDANAIPADEASFDAALSVQVFEYLTDVPGALAEVSRVLRPGGRIVLWDVDWTTLSWHSSDEDRMNRILRAWDAHLSDPALPRTLAASMRDAGFIDVETAGHAFVNTGSGLDTYGGNLIALIEDFVPSVGISAGELAAWADDLHALSATGRYSFVITQFCFSGKKPS